MVHVPGHKLDYDAMFGMGITYTGIPPLHGTQPNPEHLGELPRC